MSCFEVVFAAHFGTLIQIVALASKTVSWMCNFFLISKRRPNFDISTFLTLEIHDNVVCVCVEMLFLSDFTSCWGSEMDLWLMFGFVRNENKRGWLCEIFANKKIWNLSVSLLWKSLQNFELQKSVIDLWRLWKCKTLPNEFKFKVKLKCFSSMEKDNQIKLKISGLEKILSDLPMVLGDFVKRGESNIENPNIERVVAGQLSQFTMSFWDDMCM